MADNTIDTLELEVISNSNSAIASLDKLSKKLLEVKGSFVNLSEGGVRKFNKEVGTFTSVLKSLSHLKIKMPTISNVTRFANNLEILSNTKTSGISGLVTASENLKKISTNLSSLNVDSIDLKSTKNAIKEVLGLGLKSDLLKSENLKTIGSNLTTFSSTIDSIKNASDAISQFSNIKFDNSKLTSLINSISRLKEANTSVFNSAPLKDMADSLQVFSQVPDVSNSINRLVSSLARLAASGEKINITSAMLPELTRQLSDMIIELSHADDVSQSVNLFVQSIGRLASAGNKAKQTSEHLEELAVKLMGFFEIMKDAPDISENTVRMAEALAQLATSSSRANATANRIINSFSNLSEIDRTSSVFDRVHRSSQKASSSIGKLSNGFKDLIRSIVPLFGLYEAFSLGKKSIDIASDLIEVQNVVDNTFGDMKYKIEDLASVSIGDFGMSELTAKNISSRYQAMGIAMGFSAEKMSDMSIELTKLAADMASFYNVSQEDVALSLQSIFTGETKPLRRYGLDLTQATLQEWAMKQGIDANIRSMSQMEKTLLRYQYVMANTANIQGDFQRTSTTWANSLRTLKQSFEEWGAVIGGTLINIFKPLINTLNDVMGKVISFSKTVANALGAIFGWTIEVGGGGMTREISDMGSAISDASDGASGISDGLGNAGKKAKALKQTLSLLPFDQLNQLSKSDTSSGGAGGGGGTGGGGGGTDGGIIDESMDAHLVKTESIFDKYKSEIDSLYELGEYIGDTLTSALNSIDWDKVYEGARGFGRGLAEFLNGLISPELFGSVGKTIAASLNTAIYASLTFAENFNWKDFGNSIAEGINQFFKTFDFESLARTLNKWAAGILDSMSKALEKTNWDLIGRKIGEFLADIDFLKIGKKIGKAIWKAINAGFEFFDGMFETAPLETALVSLVAITKTLKSKPVKEFVATIKKAITQVGLFGSALRGNDDALNTLRTSFPRTARAVDVLKQAFDNFKTGLANGGVFTGINNGLRTIRDNLTATQKFVGTTIAVFGEFGILKDAFGDLITGSGNTAANIAEIGVSAGVAATAMYAALGPAGLAIAAITGLASAIVALYENSPLNKFKEEMDDLAETVRKNAENIHSDIESITSNTELMWEGESNLASDLATEYDNLRSKASLTADEKERLKTVSQNLIDLIPDLNQHIDDETGYLNIQKDALDSIIEKQKLKYKQQAYEEAIVELYKKEAEASLAVSDAERNAAEATKEYLTNAGIKEDIVSGLIDGTIQLSDVEKDYQEHINDPDYLIGKYGMSNLTKLIGKIDNAESATSEYKDAINEAKKTQDDANEKIEDMYEQLGNVTGELKKMDDAQRQSMKTSAEFQQRVINLTNDFSDMGLKISDAFAETLAFDENGEMTQGIIDTFEKMKNQTQLSKEELIQLFSMIAPETSKSFAEALSGEEPNIQAKIAMTMGNIAAGAEVSTEELKAVFSALGVNVPDALITSLAGKSPAVQQQTLSLLSELKNANELSAGNILMLFSNLGMSVPSSIITSMEGKKDDVQQKTIELLAQISNGYTGSAEQLLSEFSNLGIELPASLVNALETGKPETNAQVISLFGEVLKAEESERGPLLSKLKELGVDLVSDGFITGIDSQKEAVYASSGEMAKNTVKGYNDEILKSSKTSDSFIKSWMNDVYNSMHDSKMDFGSPSKTAGEFGADTVKGFNIGVDKTASTSNISINNWLKSVANIFPEYTSEFSKFGTDYMKNFSNSLQTQESHIMNIINNLISRLCSEFPKHNNDFTRFGTKYVENLANGIKNNMAPSLSAVNILVNTISNKMSGLSTPMYSYGRSAAQAFANGFRSVHIPTPHFYTRSYSHHKVGDTSFSTPNFGVSWYKMGGLFKSASVIGVGEAGKEAVLPLENKRTMSMIADSIMDNASNVGIDDEVLTNAVAKGVAMAMMNNYQKPIDVTCYAELKTENNEVLARAVAKGQQSLDYRMNPTPRFGY